MFHTRALFRMERSISITLLGVPLHFCAGYLVGANHVSELSLLADVELVVLSLDVEVVLLVRILIGILVVLRIAWIACHGLIGGLPVPAPILLLMLILLLFVLTALARVFLFLVCLLGVLTFVFDPPSSGRLAVVFILISIANNFALAIVICIRVVPINLCRVKDFLCNR